MPESKFVRVRVIMSLYQNNTDWRRVVIFQPNKICLINKMCKFELCFLSNQEYLSIGV